MVLFWPIPTIFLLIFLLIPSQMAIPMGKEAVDSHKSVAEMLSGLIYDQEMRMCCSGLAQSSDFAAKLNCSAVKDGILPVANGGYANPNYYSYFWTCISRRTDYTACCRGHGVDPDCLPICNAKSHPSYEEMNILLAKSCFSDVLDTLSSCIAKRRGKIRGAQIVLQLEDNEEGNGQDVEGV